MTVSRPHADRAWALLLWVPLLIAWDGAAAAQSVSERLAACARIADDGARLACYDRLSAGLAPPAPAAPTADKAPSPPAAARAGTDVPRRAAASDAADDFGLPPKPAPRVSEDRRRTMIIAEVRRTPTRKLVLYMKNGQVWRQTDSKSLPPVRPGTEATIKKGVLGSYLLRIGRSAIRVRRVR